MKRWHLFNRTAGAPHFGFGTTEEARDHLARLHARGALHPHEMTTFEEGEQPPDGALIVDLVSGDFLPERHRPA